MMVQGQIDIRQQRLQLGSVIKQYRLLKGLSQDALAKSVNLSTSFIQAIEYGHRSPSKSAFDRLVHILGIYEQDISGQLSAIRVRGCNKSPQLPSIPISENLLRAVVNAAVETERLKQKGESIDGMCELIRIITGQ